ncbi:alpha/beta family hydrolase [Actinomadura keratinilytica]
MAGGGEEGGAAPKTLDKGWEAVWGEVAGEGLPVVAGGRSAGARVACRTGAGLGAAGVLALSFPLHPPGKPERSRAEELLGTGVPTLVVQGGRDPFGRPAEFPGGATSWRRWRTAITGSPCRRRRPSARRRRSG